MSGNITHGYTNHHEIQLLYDCWFMQKVPSHWSLACILNDLRTGLCLIALSGTPCCLAHFQALGGAGSNPGPVTACELFGRKVCCCRPPPRPPAASEKFMVNRARALRSANQQTHTDSDSRV